jgi:hypothetical protein
MRRQPPLPPLLALCTGLVLGACGSLDNAPFRTGTVHGWLKEFDPAIALVSVVGRPDVRTGVDGQGEFTLEGVPAGPAELLVLATPDKAARVTLTVKGGQSVDVPDVEPRPAGVFQVKLHARGDLKIRDARVQVTGTPLEAVGMDDKGPRRMGPLPEGCYGLAVSAPGFLSGATQDCVRAGKQTALTVELEPDGDWAQKGCAQTGCDDDTHCAPDGRCVECFNDSHCCDSGECRDNRCVDGDEDP